MLLRCRPVRGKQNSPQDSVGRAHGEMFVCLLHHASVQHSRIIERITTTSLFGNERMLYRRTRSVLKKRGTNDNRKIAGSDGSGIMLFTWASGGIGIHACLRSMCESMRVRVSPRPPKALSVVYGCHCCNKRCGGDDQWKAG